MPRPGGHPLHAAGAEQARVALIVAVPHAAREHVGDGLEAAMRMVREAREVVVGIVGAELVEQQERIERIETSVPITRVMLTPAPSLVACPRTRRTTSRAAVSGVFTVAIAPLLARDRRRRGKAYFSASLRRFGRACWNRRRPRRYHAERILVHDSLGEFQRENDKLRSLQLGACVLLAVPALAQEQDFSAATIETQELGDGLYMLMLVGAGAGNIALSTGDDGSVIVDTQFAPLNAKILAAIRRAGGGRREVRHQHALARRSLRRQREFRQSRRRDHRPQQRAHAHEHRAGHGRVQSDRAALSGRRAARAHVPDARHVSLERQHRQRRSTSRTRTPTATRSCTSRT